MGPRLGHLVLNGLNPRTHDERLTLWYASKRVRPVWWRYGAKPAWFANAAAGQSIYFVIDGPKSAGRLQLAFTTVTLSAAPLQSCFRQRGIEKQRDQVRDGNSEPR
jgi:hypothetical protein